MPKLLQMKIPVLYSLLPLCEFSVVLCVNPLFSRISLDKQEEAKEEQKGHIIFEIHSEML
jgi:hypothetical protein